MKRVGLYAKVRRAVLVEGKSRREAAAFYGIHRNTVTKMLQYAEALGVVARSQGMATIAKESGLSRETLCRTLSNAGNPRLATLIDVLRAMGLRLSVAAA